MTKAEKLEILEEKAREINKKRFALENFWKIAMISSEGYQKILSEYDKNEFEINELRREISMNNRIYTTEERNRDSRFDCITGQG